MKKLTQAELAFVFSQLYDKHLEMVPQDLLEEVSKDIDGSLIAHLDPDKPFIEQDLSEETLEILASIFKDKF
jgi:hypothetical protein